VRCAGHQEGRRAEKDEKRIFGKRRAPSLDVQNIFHFTAGIGEKQEEKLNEDERRALADRIRENPLRGRKPTWIRARFKSDVQTIDTPEKKAPRFGGGPSR